MHNNGPEPIVDEVNRTLTWYFDAPSYSEQETSDVTLWIQELDVIYTTEGQPDTSINKGIKTGITVEWE